jgi:hypothetical protein
MFKTWSKRLWIELETREMTISGSKKKLQKLNQERGTILKWILKRQNERTWTGFIRLRTTSSGGLL